MEKTHKLLIGKEVMYINIDQAKNVYKQKEKSDIVVLKNEETLLHRRLYSSKVELIPLDEIEKIIYNIKDEKQKHSAILFLENRKEEKKYISSWVLNEFLTK